MMISELIKKVDDHKAVSAWDKGVKIYAYELLEELANEEPEYNYTGSPEDKAKLLNGAGDWKQYSYGGCSLIYNGDIAERLSTPSELKRKKGGELEPSSDELWIDVQARALRHAYSLINRLAK